jgi:hypothetical protein
VLALEILKRLEVQEDYLKVAPLLVAVVEPVVSVVVAILVQMEKIQIELVPLAVMETHTLQEEMAAGLLTQLVLLEIGMAVAVAVLVLQVIMAEMVVPGR